MFQTLLIANRGEIACRIIRTAKRLGIKTIAVYSDADQFSLHVREADEAYHLGPAPAEQSYLNIAAIIQAAQHAQAQAIHPGYGFLSESPQLAQACQDAGIHFIGPSIHALEIMGSKQQAKGCLANKNVPLTPGYHGADQSFSALSHAAQAVGFPLLIKAAAGGGGKGMRVVQQKSELKAAIAGAQREAKAYFSDPTLILEKYMPEARHVEVQIFGDQHGNVLSLFDRDCSVQRRHQKIIEEAPAPYLSDTTRIQLYEAACQVAKAIDYVGAGTIEFLVEPSGHFYFMEMNTRLQVEHPVTEAITGLDLVEWQLRVAQGEALPNSFSTLQPNGHAIECRIYAEDPSRHFLPSIGQVTFCAIPDGAGVRIDTGYASGDSLTPYYDPLLSKLITHGATRTEALQKMQTALKHYHIAGIATNLAFLQAILSHPAFVRGELSTLFLTQYPIPTVSDHIPPHVLCLLFAYDYARSLSTDPLTKDCFAFHPFLNLSWEQHYQYESTSLTGYIQALSSTHFSLQLNETRHDLTLNVIGKIIEVSDTHTTFSGHFFEQNHQLYCFFDGQTYVFQRLQTLQSLQEVDHANVSPMPGTVVAVLKQQGDEIKANEGILIIEAMKMEHTIRAAVSGVLTALFFKNGDQVEEGVPLFEIEA